MTRVFRERKSSRALILGAAIVAAVLALNGCGRNEGALPSGYVPEGVSGEESFLFVALDSVAGNAVSPAGTAVTVTVIDRTNADGYQIYRRLDSEDAFDQAVEYVSPFRGTFNQSAQYFQALDRDWEENRGVDYIGRATILGEESKSSPISTIGRIPPGTFADLVPQPFALTGPIDTLTVDSLLIWTEFVDANSGENIEINGFHWQAVPNAVRYLVSCIRTDGVLYITILTPPDGSPNLDLTDLTGTLQMQKILPLSPSTFFWAVDAIDADNRVIGSSPGLQIFQVAPRCALDPTVTECPEN